MRARFAAFKNSARIPNSYGEPFVKRRRLDCAMCRPVWPVFVSGSVMIVRHFLQWVRTAEAAERAEATSALARAYLYSDLIDDDRIAAEGAMIMLLDDPSPLVRRALAEALGASARSAGRRDACAAQRHAGHRRDRAGALADLARFRSGRLDRARRCRDAVRDRAPRLSAALGRGRARRSRHAGSLSDADRKSRRRHRAVLARPHRGALRPSGGDPRGAAVVARASGSDPSCADHQGVADARGLRGRVQLARRGQGAAHRAGGVREGDRDAGGECRAGAKSRRWSAICARPASSMPAWCCARCCRATSISSSRRSPSSPSCRCAASPRWCTTAAAPASRRCTTAPACRSRSIRRSAPRSRGCTRSACMPSWAATRGSSAAWSSAC